MRDPSCFLFDEPLSRLDVQLREKMRGQIKEVLAGLNKATVIVTHDQLEALTMADRIAVMRDGLIEQMRQPARDLRPAGQPVRGRLHRHAADEPAPGGPRRPGRLRRAPGRTAAAARASASTARRSFWPSTRRVGRLPPGSNVTLGIRPRSIDLIGEPQPDSLTAEVDLVEPMGAETLLHVVGPGRDLRVMVDHHVNARVGERLHLRFKPGQTHVFDGSERRVGA